MGEVCSTMQKAFYKLLRNSKTGFSFFFNGLKTYSAMTKGHLMPWSGYVATSSHCEPPCRISTLSDLDMLPTTMASWLPKVMCPPPCCYEIIYKVIYPMEMSKHMFLHDSMICQAYCPKQKFFLQLLIPNHQLSSIFAYVAVGQWSIEIPPVRISCTMIKP